MPIPYFHQITLPMLQFAADGKIWSIKEARAKLAAAFNLTEEEQQELLPSGRQSRFTNRVSWAKVYLEKAGLVHSPQRAHFQITDAGKTVLENPPEEINVSYLTRFPAFQEFSAQRSSKRIPEPSPAIPPETLQETPEESLEIAYHAIRENLGNSILNRVRSCSPRFFELLVLDLLTKMGYGKEGSSQHIGRNGDEGIDGIISEDRLGLELIYLQAKRWQGTVGRPEIQKFVGALHGKRARKGVFITTGTFSCEALDYTKTIDPRIALIDGSRLANLMIDFCVGTTTTRTYEIKEIDSDYFDLLE